MLVRYLTYDLKGIPGTKNLQKLVILAEHATLLSYTNQDKNLQENNKNNKWT